MLIVILVLALLAVYVFIAYIAYEVLDCDGVQNMDNRQSAIVFGVPLLVVNTLSVVLYSVNQLLQF